MNLSPASTARVYAATLAGTLLCVGVALFFDSFNWAAMPADVRVRAILLDIFLPTLLATPLIWLFMRKLQDQALANDRLTIFASTDPLTKVLNRSALLAIIERRLGGATDDGMPARGALLILDADNFKSINDSYGHDQGDVALKLITGAVKSVLRQSDVVGRIGGEEFLVYLPAATRFTADAVGERLRHAVSVAPFSPNGKPHKLSVSLGGAVFDRPLPLSDLLRVADQQLYVAKQNGRNRVAISPIEHYDSVPAAAA